VQKKDENIQTLQKEANSGVEILEQNKKLIETISKLHKDIEAF
jgi:hypothetical protein